MSDKEEKMQKLKLAMPAVEKPKQSKQRDATPSVWNPDWKYTPSGETDIAKKFRRIKREQALAKAKQVLGRVK